MMEGMQLSKKNNDRVLANRDIETLNVKKVFVIDEEGNKKGEMSVKAAIELANGYYEADLILIDPKQDPPVCCIGDLKKRLYWENKNKRAKNGSRSSLKEIRLTTNISENDMETKLKKINELLQKGHRVKVVVLFKGGRDP